MRPFTLTRDMLSLGGQFYPTGHILAMFPTEEAAREAARSLHQAGCPEDDILWITPQCFLEQVVRKVGDEEPAFPSPGTEGATTHHFAELAEQGHYGIMIHTPDGKCHDKVMQSLHEHHPSFAQKYRWLVIEDVE